MFYFGYLNDSHGKKCLPFLKQNTSVSILGFLVSGKIKHDYSSSIKVYLFYFFLLKITLLYKVLILRT